MALETTEAAATVVVVLGIVFLLTVLQRLARLKTEPFCAGRLPERSEVEGGVETVVAARHKLVSADGLGNR